MKNEYNTIPPKKYNGSVAGNDVTMPGRRERKPDGRFAVGDLIMNRYKVLAELGQGGMGVVYKCFDETAGVEVALKALPPELSHNTLEMEDIKENFQLVAKLIHQNIAVSKNLERDNSNGNYYLIMECVDGLDLRRVIKRKRKSGNLTLEMILPLIKQIASALDYAHSEKIIHRDIKPGNIMITPKGKVKVLDFGLAAQIHTSMTRVSMAYHGTSGTGPYMAPEQWRGRAQGAPADQYALAVMTYEMLAGRLPFESSDASVLREAVLKDTPEELENISKPAQDAIKRAMSKEPSERFASCSDFVAALGGKKVKSAKPAGKSFPKWAAVLIIAALLGAGGAGYYLFDKAKQREKVVRENYQLQPQLKRKLTDIEMASHDRGETFGKYLDELRENFIAAERAETNKDPFSANRFYKTADQAANWIIANAPLRNKVKQLQEEVAKEKAAADKFNGARLAYISYETAKSQTENANNDYKSGNFAPAEKALKSAIAAYRKACTEARNLTVESHIKSARSARSSQQWQKAYDHAVAVLAIDPNSAEGKQLKKEAENNLIPSFSIRPILHGNGLTGSLSRITLKTTPLKDDKLQSGKNYEFLYVHKRDGDTYTAKLSFVCNWKGNKKFEIDLKKDPLLTGTEKYGLRISKDKRTVMGVKDKNIRSVVIPYGIRVIGEGAFKECTNLTDVTLPRGLTTIGNEAFQKCTKLTRINIPDSVTSIGEYAFQECKSLPNIQLPYGIKTIEFFSFKGCTSLTNVTIPASVTSINYGAFNKCKSLRRLTIPNSVTSIGDYAFAYCNLESIIIPDSVVTIGKCAFFNYTDMTYLKIGNGVKTIGEDAFYGCKKLTRLIIPDSVITIGKGAFDYGESLIYLKIGENVRTIGEEAFNHCESLQSVTIPDSVTRIGADAFCLCSKLTRVNMGSGVRFIGKEAFWCCDKLQRITIPQDCQYGSGAFPNHCRVFRR